jgi:hypothetical protein
VKAENARLQGSRAMTMPPQSLCNYAPGHVQPYETCNSEFTLPAQQHAVFHILHLLNLDSMLEILSPNNEFWHSGGKSYRSSNCTWVSSLNADLRA